MTNHSQGHFALSPARHDELHDDIALALDAISGRPSERNLAEAASYLRHALRLIGAVPPRQELAPRKLDYLCGTHQPRGQA